jgi:hypothetical protein
MLHVTGVLDQSMCASAATNWQALFVLQAADLARYATNDNGKG